VESINLPARASTALLPVPCASIIIQVFGEETTLDLKNTSENFQNTLSHCVIRTGVTLFIAANAEVTLNVSQNTLLLRAHVNLS
jgi:hypothetical protein